MTIQPKKIQLKKPKPFVEIFFDVQARKFLEVRHMIHVEALSKDIPHVTRHIMPQFCENGILEKLIVFRGPEHEHVAKMVLKMFNASAPKDAEIHLTCV